MFPKDYLGAIGGPATPIFAFQSLRSRIFWQMGVIITGDIAIDGVVNSFKFQL